MATRRSSKTKVEAPEATQGSTPTEEPKPAKKERPAPEAVRRFKIQHTTFG